MATMKNCFRFTVNFAKQSFHSSCRHYATRKRFYKSTNVLYSDGKYEVILDHRKLKTPNGSLFTVKSEPLAIAVATEWNSQKENINQSSMHITALCCTALDNPNHLEKVDMINYLLNFIATDTVLYYSNENQDLKELLEKEWDPIIKWFNERYETNLVKTDGFVTPQITDSDRMNISRYLSSHNLEVLHGFSFAVDTLKSIILAFAAIDQHITVEKAVLLSRLEEEFQSGRWGRVAWAHDVHQQDLQARLAAAVLFIHLNRSEHFTKEKLVV